MVSASREIRARENAGQRVKTAPRLSAAHFAYMRAVVEGVPREDAAWRYLGLDHGHQARRMHEDAVATLRAIARRAGDSRWRIVGVEISTPAAAPGAELSKAPTLAHWVAANGFEDWSEAEQLEFYAEAFPKPTGAAASAERKLQRAQRLRRRQLAVLADLEKAAAVVAQSTDPIDAWFEPTTAARLNQAGFVMVGEVLQAARAGGRWWKGMPGVGATKAGRIATFLERLLSTAAPPPAPLQIGLKAGQGADSAPILRPSGQADTATRPLPRLGAALDGSSGTNRATRKPTVDAATDLEAIRVWVAARSRSEKTAAVYEREALRWMLWCAMERGKPMSSAGPDDCLAYMRFLQRIPAEWIHRGRRARLGEGWTPFRGQLGLAARRLAVKVLHLMCGWLVEHARYLDTNPWAAVNRGLIDGTDHPSAPSSRALTPEAYARLLHHAKVEAAHQDLPAAHRNLFILVWIRHTGLRSSELLGARVGDMRRTRTGWLLAVVGKGRKRRDVSVPSPALRALRAYLAQRELPELEQCSADVPLVASSAAANENASAGYAAVHESFKRFVTRAVRASGLPAEARARLAGTTQHWLRHTYATRFAEAGGPQDVLMAELGHADPSTTAAYYTAQLERRQTEVERLAAAS